MAASSRTGVEVRAAQPADAAALARLLGVHGQGGASGAREVADRLDAVARDGAAAVLVATDWTGAPVGVVALCWHPVLHAARPVAAITALAVEEAERRRGIGRMLLKAGAQAARVAGCDVLELAPAPDAPALDTAAAEGFCRATGFAVAGALFRRPLRKAPRDT